jgi:hypothetical protein
VRGSLILVVLAACGGPVPPAAPRPASLGARPPVVARDAPAVDPIAALAPSDDGIAWLVPGPMYLELGRRPIDGPGGTRAIAIGVIDRQGNFVRAAIRLDHARFSAWTDRDRLLAQLARDQHVSQRPGGEMPSEREVVLRAGAKVRRLARKAEWTQVRYVGAIEVEGWVPESMLAETGPRRDPIGRIPTGRRTLMVIPGAVVRTEPRWASRALATVATGYFLDTIQELDAAWVEVAYADGEVTLHGFVSRRDPPGRVHRSKDPDVPLPVVVPNAKVASGTCLYSRSAGDPIGYVVGDRDVELDDLGGGWWTLTLDTPWGPIGFGARGPTKSDLVACAPPGSVPAPAGAPASVP